MYAAELYGRPTMARLADSYSRLLEAVAVDPALRISDLRQLASTGPQPLLLE